MRASLNTIAEEFVTKDFAFSLIIAEVDDLTVESPTTEVNGDEPPQTKTESYASDNQSEPSVASSNSTDAASASLWDHLATEIKNRPAPSDDLQRLTMSEKVSDSGVFNMTASEDFFFESLLRNVLFEEPENRTEVLNITVLQEADTDSDSLVEAKFTWTVKGVTRDTITVQLEFEEPILVSSGGRIEHIVSVEVLEESRFIFVSSSGMQVDPQDYEQVKPVPMQNTLDESWQKALQVAAQTTAIAFSGSSVVQVLIGSGL